MRLEVLVNCKNNIKNIVVQIGKFYYLCGEFKLVKMKTLYYINLLFLVLYSLITLICFIQGWWLSGLANCVVTILFVNNLIHYHRKWKK